MSCLLCALYLYNKPTILCSFAFGQYLLRQLTYPETSFFVPKVFDNFSKFIIKNQTYKERRLKDYRLWRYFSITPYSTVCLLYTSIIYISKFEVNIKYKSPQKKQNYRRFLQKQITCSF